MYFRVTALTGVVGRIGYARDKEDPEEVLGFADTAPKGFWEALAAESQQQFELSPNAKRKGYRACEGREFVIGLPLWVDDDMSAMMLAQQVKLALGVECVVAIHHKKEIQDDGSVKINRHAHCIVAERTLLPEPVVVPEQRAQRTYFYDAAGKKCGKSKAVRSTQKGTLLAPEHVRRFTDKRNFFNLEPTFGALLDQLGKQFGWDKFDGERHFAQRHIGKGNPKGAFIADYNELVKRMNAVFDKLDAEAPQGATPAKQQFCEATGCPQRFTVPQTDRVRKQFQEWCAELRREQQRRDAERQAAERAAQRSAMQAVYTQLQPLLNEEAQIVDTIEQCEAVFAAEASDDFVANVQSRGRRETLEREHGKPLEVLVAFLRNRLAELRNAIAGFRYMLETWGAVVPGSRDEPRVVPLHDDHRHDRDDRDER